MYICCNCNLCEVQRSFWPGDERKIKVDFIIYDMQASVLYCNDFAINGCMMHFATCEVSFCLTYNSFFIVRLKVAVHKFQKRKVTGIKMSRKRVIYESPYNVLHFLFRT